MLPLTTAEFCQTLLPHSSQVDLDFEAVADFLTFRGVEFAGRIRQEVAKDCAKVLVDLFPGLVQGLLLLNVEGLDCVFDLLLVVLHNRQLLLQGLLLLFNPVKLLLKTFRHRSFEDQKYLSIMFMTLRLTFLDRRVWLSSSCSRRFLASAALTLPKSYAVPGTPKCLSFLTK